MQTFRGSPLCVRVSVRGSDHLPVGGGGGGGDGGDDGLYQPRQPPPLVYRWLVHVRALVVRAIYGLRSIFLILLMFIDN